MVKLISKTALLTLLICCTTILAKAQLGYNFSQYDIGTGVGFNSVAGDAETKTTTTSIHFNFTYNATPFTNFVFEAQLGKLAGGDSLKTATGRQFNNNFSAFSFRGQLQLGEILDYERSPFMNGLKNLYISAGIGFVFNSLKPISRYSTLIPGFYTDGQDKSKEPFIPVKIGYELKLYNRYDQPSAKIDLGYQVNVILGDGLDGYSVIPGHHDIYTQIVLGVKFAIGPAVTSYRKQIRY